jgi:hypothetical protein
MPKSARPNIRMKNIFGEKDQFDLAVQGVCGIVLEGCKKCHIL